MGENTQAVADGATSTTTKPSSLYRKVEAAIDQLAELEHRAADLRHKAVQEECHAFLGAEGANLDVRKSKAKVVAQLALKEAEHAEVDVAAGRRKVDLLLRLVTAGGLQA